MPFEKKAHVRLNNKYYVVQDETHTKQLQTAFNSRFGVGDPGFGDLSFFSYEAMEDFSGGNGQENFVVSNRFLDSDGVDVTKEGELKLAPDIELVTTINGPEKEHLNDPVEQEDAWPQIIEWLGRAIIFNDKIEFDSGGLEFLEVFDTDVLRDRVISTDPSGTNGVVTNDARAEILSISKPHGLPGETITVRVQFKRPEVDMSTGISVVYHYPDLPHGVPTFTLPFRFRLDFGGEAAKESDVYVNQDIDFSRQSGQFEYLGTTVNYNGGVFGNGPAYYQFRLNRNVIVDFTVKIPNKEPGIYKLWTSAGWPGAPFKPRDFQGIEFEESNIIPSIISRRPYDTDPESHANVLFYIESVDKILVERKNLYTPQLKAACVVGNKLVGFRTVEGVGYLEVYEEQDGAVDRTLQLSLVDAALDETNPTYAEILGYNDVIVVTLDNKVFKVDIENTGLTAQQRFTSIGQVPGTYVSGLAIWNQRVYGASFDKSLFQSTIWWTDLEEIQGSYAIDGKFWITDMANFQGSLFYSGGTQDGIGEIRGFPAVKILETEHPAFDSRIRSLNAGRRLYAGLSHVTGLGAITERGASAWARKEFEDAATNVVWDVEEVGSNVFLIVGNGIYKTNANFSPSGYLETSRFGGATPLIDKIWNEVKIEATELKDGQTIRILATNAARPEGEWVVLGEMTAADGLEKTFKFPEGFISQWSQVRLELSTTDPGSSPIVRRVLVKYVPNALQKWQWVFTVRGTGGLVLVDGKKDPRQGSQIVLDLEALRSGGPIKFVDTDDQEFDVILTDMKIVRPLLNQEGEALVSLELLEA